MAQVSYLFKEVSLPQFKAACSGCSLKELCLPVGLGTDEIAELESFIHRGRAAKKGEYLYRAEAPFTSLYAVKAGCFKTSVISEDGREQVTGFHMSGEIIGMDAISTERHTCSAIALEDSEICEIPFVQLEELCRKIPALQRHFYKVMSREIVRDHGVMLLLGNMKAEERLAAFLLNLSQRFQSRGYSPRAFHLRMTREEIGSFLGMKLETVSRIFSRFQDERLIRVSNREIELLDMLRLKQLLNGCSSK
jgi:CRP/FNR family transcriptional regulator